MRVSYAECAILHVEILKKDNVTIVKLNFELYNVVLK